MALLAALPFSALLLPPAHPAARADEVGLTSCGPRFVVRGDINHASYSSDRVVEGATSPEMYADEVYGKDFTAAVEDLPEGDYTIEIYLAEMSKKEPGARVMDILYGDDPIAENLDIYAEAGADREYVVGKLVAHKGDSINGPLTITFKTRANNAKFNAIVIKNGDGEVVSCVNARDLFNEDDLWASTIPRVDAPIVHTDTGLPFDVRIDDLIRRMSLKEKVGQLMNGAPAIERLGVPGYDYWNECLHGVARAGHATVFPQAIGLAAMWDIDMMGRVADTIATEGRAKNNAARAKDPNTRKYYGLTFWTPNINIFRDPRWGRGHETYGEDPYLTGRLSVAFIRGLQGEDPKYIKAMACAKHFAVHSGPEKLRHSFNAVVSERDLYETYLPQFETAVTEGKVGIVMSVYNAVDGVPGPANKFLLTEVLRNRWGFDGHVVSDCGAVRDIWKNHQYAETPAEASALAVKAGNDLNCGGTYKALTTAVKDGLLSEAEIDVALKRVLMARFRLGLFDSPEQCSYLTIPETMNDTPENSRLALEAAQKSIVLLKNDGVLPLNRDDLDCIAIIGPNADSVDALVGNYAGDPSYPVTILQGIRNKLGGQVKIAYTGGCPLALAPDESYSVDGQEGRLALEAARVADAVVFVGGLDARLEGEEMRTSYEGFDRGDRVTIELPRPQSDLLKALAETGKPVVFVNLSGSAIAMPWEASRLPAIVQAWYPGQNGGDAVADVLFGDHNPGGRLPVTFYRSTEDLPDFADYSMENRTYRYFKGEPLYAFGHGLSYTTFAYGKVNASASELEKDGSVRISIQVTNNGEHAGDEIVQMYVRRVDSEQPQPLHSLAGFKRISLDKGASAAVDFDLPASALRYWDVDTHAYIVPSGDFEVRIGASSADIRETVLLKIL
jgi:beta-glucosidase